MAARLRETKNYELFELHEFNRNVEKINKLEKSMIEYGWVDAYPMHVVMNGSEKLKIKGGHHRFIVAKKLNIPVKYVICDDNNISIHQLESATNPWTLKDYLESYSRQGIQSYITVKEYHERTGINLGMCISMLAGEMAGSNNKIDLFKDGKFKIAKNIKRAEMVAFIILSLKTMGIEIAISALFVRAISRISYVKEFDPEIFIRKCESFKTLLVKQVLLNDYLKLIEDIYNRKQQHKIPLVFLADLDARQRNKVGAKCQE